MRTALSSDKAALRQSPTPRLEGRTGPKVADDFTIVWKYAFIQEENQ